MGRRLIRLGLITAFGLALIHGISLAGAWWSGTAPDGWDWFWLAQLPLLVWIYFRYFSVFAPGHGQCLLPRDDGRDRAES